MKTTPWEWYLVLVLREYISSESWKKEKPVYNWRNMPAPASVLSGTAKLWRGAVGSVTGSLASICSLFYMHRNAPTPPTQSRRLARVS